MSNKSRICSNAEAAGFGFFCSEFGGGFMGGFLVLFFTPLAALAVSITVILFVKSNIGVFWGLPFSDDWNSRYYHHCCLEVL